MKTGRYELVIEWANGDRDVYTYDTKDQAEKSQFGMRMALGDQIGWIGIRPELT